MKVLVVLALTLACVSAASIPDAPVFLKDLKGAKVIDERITNGYEAYPGLFPYQVGLSLNGPYGSFWCGGSLIGSSWVLTAAHCTNGVRSATVYLGSTVRTVAKVTYNVDYTSFIQHTGFNLNGLAHDISLIRIPEVTYSDEIQPVRLPAMSNSYPSFVGSYGIASGWGRDRDYGSVVSNLMYTYLEVISNAECAQTYGSLISNKNLCVATPSGSSTCKGDSGGPLVLDSTQELIGVTSFVSNLGCQAGLPAGFVRVTCYLDWIKDHTDIYY